MPSQVRYVVALASAFAIVAACVGDDPQSGIAPGTDAAGGSDGTSNDGNDNGSGDGSVPTDAPVDSPADADAGAGPACDPTKPFTSPPTRLDELIINAGDVDDAARISPNGLELYLARRTNGTGPRQIVRYVRVTLQSPWVLDQTLPILSTADGGSTAANGFTMMPDGLTAFYTYYYAGGTHGVWATTRQNVLSSSWSAPKTIPGFGSDQGFPDFNPYLSTDGTHVYFQSDRSTGTHAHHFDVIQDGGAVTNLSRVNITLADGGGAPANEFSPIISGDLKTLYFGHFTNDVPGGGQERYIFRATRATASGDFSNAALVSELYVNGAYGQPTWISPDDCTMLFISNRSPGGFKVWHATRPK